MVARIARLFGQALPTDISVTVETALDLKSRLACLGAVCVGTKAALLLRHESSRHRGGNYGHHEHEHSSPPDFKGDPRASARRVQAADQNPDRAAIGRYGGDVVLGAARFRSDQYAQGRWLADACNKEHRSTN